MNRIWTAAGVMVLALAWLGPLPGLVRLSFSAHMVLHMMVVGVGVPMLAYGIAPALSIPSRAPVALPVAVSLADLIVVWGWHAPALHHAARAGGAWLALEQGMFAVAAGLVWLTAFAAPGGRRQMAALAGGMTLFFTSMHMTLLGALIALAPRPLFPHHPGSLADQQLGGAVMLTVGAVVYLGGALVLFARVLRPEARA